MWKLLSALFFCLSICNAFAKNGEFRISEDGMKNAAYLHDSAMFHLYSQRENKEKALEYLLKSLEQKSDSVYLIIQLFSFYKRGDIREDALLEFIWKHPESPALSSIVAEHFITSQKKDIARDLMERSIAFRLDPPAEGGSPRGVKGKKQEKDFQVLLMIYLRSLQNENSFEKADAFLEKLFRTCPMELSEKMLMSLMEYYLAAHKKFPGKNYKAKFREFSEKLKNRIVTENSFLSVVNKDFIEALAAERETELIEMLLTESLITDPKAPATYTNLQSLYAFYNEPKLLLRTLKLGVQQFAANDPQILLQRLPLILELSLREDDEQEVQKQIGVMMKFNLMNENLYYLCADYFFERNNLKQAKFFTSRIQSPVIKGILSVTILMREKKYSEALKRVLQLERIFPEDPYYKILAAESARKSGDLETESQFMKEMYRKAGKSPDFCNYVGYTWAEQGIKLDQAEELLKKALKSSPDNYAYLDSMAWIYYKKKDYTNARIYIDQALKACSKERNKGVILDHAGDIYAELGDIKKARIFWQKAVQTEDPELETGAVLKKLNPEPVRESPEVQSPKSAADDLKKEPAELKTK